ncbi:anthranilate phosphoribosyltransferase, partial [Acidobacteriia bacterium AH_259_A11_L15]|nr:anthranilate phosphoribosyltransferase [Acidobacteriia bacterium AH_259_A11_L15]
LLGPLTNPAGVDAQVLGVFDAHWLEPVARALRELGVRQAFVLHSRDGLDEASLSDATEFVEVRAGEIRRGEFAPEDFGLPRAPRDALRGGDAEANAKIIERVFAGEPGPPRDIVLMNAALALVAAGRARDPSAPLRAGYREGVAQARHAIDSGAARDRLGALIEFSNRPPEVQK